jgi:hypothetical protein
MITPMEIARVIAWARKQEGVIDSLDMHRTMAG